MLRERSMGDYQSLQRNHIQGMKGLKSNYHIGQKFTQKSPSRTEALGITEAKKARSLRKGLLTVSYWREHRDRA